MRLEDVQHVLSQFNAIKHIICRCSSEDTLEKRINLKIFKELLTEIRQKLFIQKKQKKLAHIKDMDT